MTLERGTLLNRRYRIVEILGQGGMASVYRAVDENLGVEVAVKENLFTTEEYARQFRREAVILANLRHPNLPRVTDHFVIEQQGQYLVMDYIEGEDLRDRMDRLKILPEHDVIVLGVAICDALTYLHSRSPQVLHRDIKPGNVKITPNGQVYLVDFGLAKMVSGRQVTTTGARAMTPGFSPPEQYGTARTDHRSDIYSLGATLYSALTSEIPEDGLARAMEQLVLTPLPRRNSKVSRRLAAVIEEALEIRPDDRYQSAEDFKEALLNARTTTRRRLPLELMLTPPPDQGEAATAEDIHAAVDEMISEVAPASSPGRNLLSDIAYQPIPRRRRKPAWFVWLPWLIALGILSVASVAYIINPDLPSQLTGLFRPSAVPTVTLAAIVQVPTPTRLLTKTFTSRPSSTPHPTFTWTPAPTKTITLTPTESPTPKASPTPIGSGSGEIAFASNRAGAPNIWAIRIDGSELRQLTFYGEGACQPRWSPDGAQLVFISPCNRNREVYPGSSLFLIKGDGSDITPLPSVPGGDFDPAWSPDGKKIAFVSYRNSDVAQIYVLDLEDYSVSLLGEDPPRNNYNPAWSPDCQLMVYSDNLIRVMSLDGSGRYMAARNIGSAKNTNPIWSPDGKTIIFTQWSSDLSLTWLMAVPFNPEGALPVKIPGTDNMVEASYSPDGFWIVTSGYPESRRDIYIMTSGGVSVKRLTNDEAYDFDPVWRPWVVEP